VLVSTNAGKSWIFSACDMSGFNVTGLAVGSANLFAGTYGKGLWRHPL